MRKIKILFITKNFALHLEKSSDYLTEELEKQADLRMWHRNGSIQDILAQLGWEPDFILLNDFKPDYCPFVRGFRHIRIPVGIIMHDLYYKKATRRRFIEKENIRHIFTIYRDAFLKMYPEYASRMVWLPHHVSTDIFQDYGCGKTINWLMMGSMIRRLYPLRVKMLNAMKSKPGFVHHCHPGYDLKDKDGKYVFVGREYAKEINRAKMFLTCDSVCHFPVLKYFEVLACQTLLLAPHSKELSDLGFVDGENFVAVNESNFVQKANAYLENKAERVRIAGNGYEMVRARHSTSQRVRELLENIKMIKGKKSHGKGFSGDSVL